MFNHAPKNYICPICLGVKGIESKDTLLRQTDLVFKDKKVSVFVNSFGIGLRPGHLIVVPNEHIENVYTLPEDLALVILKTAKKAALGLKDVLGCEGVMLLQNNEPVSGQHAFHFHMHVFPRFEGDDLYKLMGKKQLMDAAFRDDLARKLREAW